MKQELTFSDLNLNNSLLKALAAQGLEQPTEIQKQVFAVIMSGKDVLGIAQTGTGKTLAYLLPMLRLWNFSKQPHPQALIIVPTRELVAQVTEEIEKLTTFINFSVVGVYGGVNIKTQSARILQGVDYVVGTPGRMFDLIANGSLNTKAIKRIVIDEVDEMMSLGFLPQLKNILDMLPEKRQNLMFSATMNDKIEELIEDFFNAPEKIQVSATGSPLEKIDQYAFAVPNFNTKTNLLELFLKEKQDFSKCLIFVRSRKRADLLLDSLKERGIKQLGVIHSNKAQNTRLATTESFENNEIVHLIATDLFARGIDISQISHVINFDMPEDSEFYMHRMGRTGRAENAGTTISFYDETEAELLADAEVYMNFKVQKLELPENLKISDELLEEEKERLKMPNVFVKIASKPSMHKKKTRVNNMENTKKAKKAKKRKDKKPKRKEQRK
jgi:ATP-dependent RNA helicase RhlE